MKYIIFITALLVSSGAFSQSKERATISGSRISIEKTENLLIPKHTSTVYIDSTIEFMIVEFANVENVKDWMVMNSYPIEGPDIRESFALDVFRGEAQVLVSEFNSIKDIIYCYMGDSSFGILASCIFKRTDASVRQQVLDIIQSIRIIDQPKVDWESFLSFSYDQSNAMKLVDEKYTVGIRFTPDGKLNDSLFNATNMTVLQFPPAPFVKSSKDLMMAMISAELEGMEIKDVMFDGETQVNNQPAYKFWAKVTVLGVNFELMYLTLFDPKSSVVIKCNIIDGEFQQDVYDFVDSIKLKRDGY